MNNKFDKLIKSVKKGQIQKASEILQQATLNINQLDPKSGKSLLQIAIENENQQIFNMLVAYPGLDIQKPSKQGQLPLQTAIMMNNFYFVNKILETGNVNPRKKNSAQQTPLQVAVKQQTSPDIIKKLLQYKFDINQPVGKHGSLINLAIVSNQMQNLNFLLNGVNRNKDQQAKINVLDQNDNTCLILAVQYSRGDAVLAILDYLLSEDCQLAALDKQFFINSQNKQGNTALHIACLKNLQTIMSLIQTKGKQLGIDTSLKNKKGFTPSDIKQQTQKQRLMQNQLKQKNQQQKRIYLKQKQQQKQRMREQEERLRVQQKKKKKEQELLLLKQQQYEKEVTTSKTRWVCGIIVILILAMMYLVILNTIESKKTNQL